MDARLLGGLITGVRRAFPFVAPDQVEPLVEQHGTALFRMIHKAPFSVGVQVGVGEGARHGAVQDDP